MSFLNSIQNQSKKHEFPFDHWEYNNALLMVQLKKLLKQIFLMLVNIILIMMEREQSMVVQLNLERG